MTEKLIFMGIAILCVVIGYFMGLKSARPDEKLITLHRDQGSTDEPEGDIFNDAMLSPDPDAEMDMRVGTR